MTRPALVDALLRPEAHPVGGDEVELRETHISWLFLTAAHVYKLKKPVDFGFLDFTTPAKRESACRDELRLNRRLSPDVYEAVVPVTDEGGGAYRFGGGGPVVDHAVRMRRLPEDRWLDVLLRTGDVEEKDARRIARRIAAFHATAETGPEIVREGGVEAVRFNTEENFRQVEPFVGRAIDDATFRTTRAYTRAFLDGRRDEFLAREREGRVVDGHGDLHAGQICIENGIDFIDCIEFNHRFRYGDVASDVAFLVMDLEHSGRPDLAGAFLDEYVERSGDSALEGHLRFYTVYRAFTRGKVACLQADQIDGEGPEEAEAREELFERARGYLRHARRDAVLPSPVLVATTGLMGSGKSTLGRAVAAALGLETASSDVVRKELHDLEPGERRDDAWGEGLYSEGATGRTYEELARRAHRALASGRAVVIDASFREESRRDLLRGVARELDVPVLFLDCRCPGAELKRRLDRRRAEGGDPSDGRTELLSRQIAAFEEESGGRDLADVVAVDTSDSAPEASEHALRSIYAAAIERSRSGAGA